MPDFVLFRKPALFFASIGGIDAPLRLAAMPEGRILQVLAPAGASADAGLAERLREALAGGEPLAIRSYAPGQWFVVGDRPLETGEFARLKERIAHHAAVSDQSHGRVRIALEGREARRILATGTAVDLADARFPVGASAQTLFGHIGVHITRIAPTRYELIALRSFAVDLWQELAHVGAEFLNKTTKPA